MITLKEWNERIDSFIEEENRSAGRVVPVHRIYCRDDSDRSGGGLYNETVTIDTIGRFARALGDSNPLYSDPMHPEAIQAPPLLECCICSTFIGGKMPRLRGVSVYDAGTKWERFLSIRPGDAFRAETAFLGVAEVTRPGSGNRLLLRSHKITLYNQRGETVSVLTARSLIKCLSPDKCLPPVPAEGSVTAYAGSCREAVGLTKGQDSGLSAGLSYQGRPHYTEEELEAMGKFLSELPEVTGLELLPYHRLGTDTYRKLGREYLLKDVEVPSPEHMEWCRSVVRRHYTNIVE